MTTAGVFRGEHVLATLSRAADGSLTALTIELDGASDIPIAWTGPATVGTGDSDGRSGRATFEGQEHDLHYIQGLLEQRW